MTARSVIDVVLGEAVSGTEEERYEDMKAIASAIVNRSRRTGVSLQDVVANRNEFNAYGKALPKGANRYRDLAERALRDVEENGPVHGATFYATPSAIKNLPKGLSRVAETKGHVYFDDPKNRAIGTAKGYKQPSRAPATAYASARPQTGATQAINTGLLGTAQSRTGGLLASVPTPTAAPRGGILGASTAPAMSAARSVPTPTSREAAALQPTLTDRFAGGRPLSVGWDQGPMPQSMIDRYASTRPSVKGGRVGPSPSIAASRSSFSPAQEANLAGRIGTIEPTRQVQPSRAAQLGQVAAGLLGVSPAAASELPAGARLQTSGFAGAIGSPRSMEASLPAGALDGLLATSSRVAPQHSSLAQTNARPAPITTSRTIADAPRVASPQRVGVQAAQPRTGAVDAWGGLRGSVSGAQANYAPQEAPSATPNQPKPERSWQQKAAVVAGGLLGGAVAGPIGGILGGAIANTAVNRGLLSSTQRTAPQSNGGYATSLPERPNAPTAAQKREFERSLAERRSGGEGPSMSRETRDSISSGRAGGGLF